ncbi:ABC transporter permease [Reichenbachiella carrageenanivorans]|uniref:ABC transporter permease n=1 Tax=Reichenbachiella carrageenanivorans TaxID=2979869 RepID=A0ABY6CXS9_9BACT|nr:FtsX-like permease family protein [Reichenbachiella carrageenanivorans]UXX78180.1 ABC transporter permease [Reichenbachiella carrageenanivorans]
MNFPYFISKRITSEANSSFSSTISKLAIISISAGLAAMILAFFILGGFQHTIKEKIYNFKGHLEITKYNMGNALDEKSISFDSDFYQQKAQFEFVDHVQAFAFKPGLIKTEEEVEGVGFKGVDSQFDTVRFGENMRQGRFIHHPKEGYSNEVILSQHISNKLRLSIGDEFMIHFVQNPPRFRKLKLVGIYETGLEEFDKSVMIGDLSMIQRLNGWNEDQVGGFEVFVKDIGQIDEAEDILFNAIDADLYVDKVSDKYSQIFDWLGLLNQNVTVFLGLILIVACFNMISILLILILERTYMIGVLQALGASKRQIKRIFLFKGILLVTKGLIYGNVIALLIALLQDQFHLVPLDAANYYMYYVPISWDYESLIGLNVLTFLVVTLALGIPMTVVSRIKPITAIRFN